MRRATVEPPGNVTSDTSLRPSTKLPTVVNAGRVMVGAPIGPDFQPVASRRVTEGRPALRLPFPTRAALAEVPQCPQRTKLRTPIG